MVDIILYGIISGFTIGLLALAFQINYKIYKFFDLSQAGIYVCSTYVFICFMDIIPFGNHFIGMISSLIATCVFSWVLSILIHKYIYKLFFKKKSSSLNFLIVSLAIYTILINLIVMIFGTDIQIINIPEISFDSFTLFSIVFTRIQIIEIVIFGILVTLLFYVLFNRKLGKKILAISDNEELFKIHGYNVSKARNIILFISSTLIVFVSIMHSIEYGIDPNITGFQMLLQGVVAMIIGGVDSYKGAIFGGVFIGILSNLGSNYFSSEWQESITYIILLVVLLFKKDGFFSVKLRLER